MMHDEDDRYKGATCGDPPVAFPSRDLELACPA
jgi:hypothetical protein